MKVSFLALLCFSIIPRVLGALVWPTDFLEFVLCLLVPLFFFPGGSNISFCTRPDIVLVDIYRSYQENGTTKTYPITTAEAATQIDGLNFWFEGKVTFQLGDIKDYRPDLFNTPAGVWPCGIVSDDSTNGVFNPRRISAIYINEFGYLNNGAELNGCVNVVDFPADGVNAPYAMMANRPAFGSPFTNNVLSLTLAHEVGHLMGFRHTSLSDRSTVYTYAECGLDLKYPAFGPDEESFQDVDGTVYNNEDWNSRVNLMAPASNVDFANIGSVHLFDNAYDSIFSQMVDCWLERSTLDS